MHDIFQLNCTVKLIVTENLMIINLKMLLYLNVSCNIISEDKINKIKKYYCVFDNVFNLVFNGELFGVDDIGQNLTGIISYRIVAVVNIISDLITD